MPGFVYDIECVDAHNNVLWTERAHNLVPSVAWDYILGASLESAARYGSWYVGIYSNSYSPSTSDTMTTLIAGASEITTAYSESTRELFVSDGISNGTYTNYDSPAEFTFVSSATARGGFISSGSTKGSNSGLLLSAVLFSTPRTVSAGETLRVRAGIQFASA